MHISPTIHYSAGHSYKNQYTLILELMNLLHRNKFSPWEDFFVNPFGSDVISPNRLYVSVHVSVQVLVEVASSPGPPSARNF